MLVLSRKIGERIFIVEGIELMVVDVQGRRVKLGVVAPADVPIRRAEVERIERPSQALLRKPA